MDNNLPDHVRDYKLRTLSITKYEVVHIWDDPDAPPSSQHRVECWKREKRLGGGGQGQVFLQVKSQGNTTGDGLNARRAVKVIPIREHSGRRPYTRELETIIKFSHSRYARYFAKSFGWYESKNSLYITMEYFPEGDLHALLGGQGLTENDSRHIISQVVQGLEYMHGEGFIHGDIKPKNVLIKHRATPEGAHTWWVKLADFGISKRVREMSGTTTVMGTEEYMDPELFLGRQDINYAAADMWAVGAMAFRMLTQTPAFSAPGKAIECIESADGLFPRHHFNNYHVGKDGQDFICALLSRPGKRLDSKGALHHAWIQSCVPSAPAILPTAHGRSSPLSSAPSSTPSSRRSSFGDERGMTTQISSTLRTGSFPLRNMSYEDNMDKPTTNVVTTPPIVQHNNKPASLPPMQESHDIPNPVQVREDSSNQYSEQLLNAAKNGHVEMIGLLVEDGAALNIRNQYEETALHQAAYNGSTEVIELLLEKGADINARDRKKDTALHYASWYGHLEVVNLLLAKGANMNLRNIAEEVALHHASNQGHTKVVKLLLERGAPLNIRNSGDNTALQYASQYGHLEVVKLLLEKGADINNRSQIGELALHYASHHGHTEIVNLLLEKGAPIDVRDYEDNTALHYASYHGHFEVAKLLLEKGADINIRSKKGGVALQYASHNGHTEVVELLLEKGADINIRNEKGEVALHYASHYGHTEVVKLLFKKGADISLRSQIGELALHYASHHGYTDIVNLLLEKGAPIDVRDHEDNTALHYASYHGHFEVAKLLVGKGADINIRNKKQETALHYASRYGHTEIVKLLLKAVDKGSKPKPTDTTNIGHI